MLRRPHPAYAQSGTGVTPTPEGENAPSNAPNEVNVVPAARDDEISKRLQSILDSTGWYSNPVVEVKDGVVFLTGQTKTADFKKWAGDLAGKTQDVVAVVNKIELAQPSIWDFQPAFTALQDFWLSLVRSIPLVLFSILILIVTWVIIRLTMIATRSSLRRTLKNPLLSNVAAYTLGILIFLIGLYIILQVGGLTNAATTIIGGTGLLGLVLGIAFRDITENFLASIFLSVQDPFHPNDLIEINGIMGFVQALTIRVTVLMTLDGTIVQIPNATVYKSNLYNYTSNPTRRTDFIIGIGYKDSVTDAQKVAMKVLEEHPAVLQDPEPLVLAESLGNSSVKLHIYYWMDSKNNSWLKVKSSVIRLVKRSFQDAGISMPDESREVIFPQGIHVQWMKPDGTPEPSQVADRMARPAVNQVPDLNASASEGGLSSETHEIQEQARFARIPDEDDNLLMPSESEENVHKKAG